MNMHIGFDSLLIHCIRRAASDGKTSNKCLSNQCELELLSQNRMHRIQRKVPFFVTTEKVPEGCQVSCLGFQYAPEWVNLRLGILERNLRPGTPFFQFGLYR